MTGDKRWDMRAVFDVSYNDLDPADQRRFRALSVFHPAGFSPAAAAQVWDDEGGQADDALSRLVNLSLVKAVEGEHERWRLHDLLDEYAAPLLAQSGEQEAAAGKLANWLVALFDEHFTDDISNAPEVGLEFENLHRAADWAMEHKQGETLALLATRPRNWLIIYFPLLIWLDWLESSLQFGIDNSSEDGKQLKANVRKAMGDVQQFRDERDAALESYNEALKLFRQVGSKLGEANVLQAMGDVQQFRKENDAALESYNEALKLFRQVGDKLGEANVLAALSHMSIAEGRVAEAEAQLEAIIQMRRAIGDQYSEGADYGNFAIALLNAGYKEKAKIYAERARQIFEKIQIPALVQMMERVIAACK